MSLDSLTNRLILMLKTTAFRLPAHSIKKALKLLLFSATLTSFISPAAAQSAAENLIISSKKYIRPYGTQAPWNVPVRSLLQHPQTEYYSQLLWRKAPNRPGNFNLSFDEYTYPVYSTADAQGYIKVKTRWASNLNGKTMPWHSDWKGAPGNDAQVIVLDEVRGLEWNLFQVSVRGSTVSATNGNLVPGDYRKRTNGFAPSRGIGIPYLAMLVRPEEVAAGRIDHALSMPIRNPSGEYYVAPATKLERATGKSGIPIGMRFALKVSDHEIQTWLAQKSNMTPATKRSAYVIARALRDYGWFVTDTAGSASFQFEANITARQDWKLLGLGDTKGGGQVFPRDLLDGLITEERIYAIVPSDKYR